MNDRTSEKKVVLITGASAGIGRETARILLAAGHVVYATARDPKKVADLARAGARTLALDVENEASIRKAVATIAKKEGRIDILVNNAGYGSYGAVEDVPLEEARRQFEVNLFGLARVTQLVLPLMRARKSGRIVNIASIAGRFSVPLGAWYHASKHAVEAFSDALRLETRQFGIRVVIVEPGLVATDWIRIARDGLLRTSGQTAYGELAETMAPFFGATGATEVRGVARIVARAATKRRPPARYAVPAKAVFLLFCHRFLPDWLQDRVIRRQFGIR